MTEGKAVAELERRIAVLLQMVKERDEEIQALKEELLYKEAEIALLNDLQKVPPPDPSFVPALEPGTVALPLSPTSMSTSLPPSLPVLSPAPAKPPVPLDPYFSAPLPPTLADPVKSGSPQSEQTTDEDAWSGIDKMIDEFMDLELPPENKSPVSNEPPAATHDPADDVLDNVDGFLVPRRLTRFVKKTSVQIARTSGPTGVRNTMEEDMLESLHEALTSSIRITGEQSPRGAVKTLFSNNPQLEESFGRQRSQIQVRNSLHGTLRRSDANGKGSKIVEKAPAWLTYHWICPKTSALSKPSQSLLSSSKLMNPLSEVLFVSNCELTKILCQVTPITEADELSKHLIRIFDASKMSLALLEHLVTNEIAETKISTTLFRSNTITSKILTFYARSTGKSYLQATLGPFIKSLGTFGAIEVDPAKLSDRDTVQNNMQQLQSACSSLITAIANSLEDCPHPFRKICHIIREHTSAKFPGMETTAVGGFIFLRFLCPAIVAPEGFGLLKTPPSDSERRTLILISKVIQNMANGVKFGTKEIFMSPMNDFMDQKMPLVSNFMASLATVPSPFKELSVTVPTSMIEESFSRLSSMVESMLGKIEDKMKSSLVIEVINHSLSEDLGAILYDFPKENQMDRALNDFSLLSRFEELLLAEDFAVLTNLMKVIANGSKDLDQLSRASLNVLAPRQAALHFVSKMFEYDLKGLENPAKILDTVSVSLRLASVYINSFGGDYLRKILSAVIREICQGDKNYEVDPYHLAQGENAQKNMDALVTTAYQVLGCIVNSLATCPGIIRKLLHDIHSLVKERTDVPTANMVASQLLFMRFFCPAIASPESYQLVSRPPSKKAHRALILVSYSLKHLTSGTLFKEANMTDMNTFIRDNQQNTQEFLSKICAQGAHRQSIQEPVGSFEHRAQALVAIRGLMGKDAVAKMNEIFDKTAVEENVTYKLIDRVAAILAERYKHR